MVWYGVFWHISNPTDLTPFLYLHYCNTEQLYVWWWNKITIKHVEKLEYFSRSYKFSSRICTAFFVVIRDVAEQIKVGSVHSRSPVYVDCKWNSPSEENSKTEPLCYMYSRYSSTIKISSCSKATCLKITQPYAHNGDVSRYEWNNLEWENNNNRSNIWLTLSYHTHWQCFTWTQVSKIYHQQERVNLWLFLFYGNSGADPENFQRGGGVWGGNFWKKNICWYTYECVYK